MFYSLRRFIAKFDDNKEKDIAIKNNCSEKKKNLSGNLQVYDDENSKFNNNVDDDDDEDK